MNTLMEQGQTGATKVRELLQPIVERFPLDQQPLLLALLERNAAKRYRGWAELTSNVAEREGLEACAAREEKIARLVEGLAGRPADLSEALVPHLDDLRTAYETVFSGKRREEQMAIQAAAERIGALVWRELAATETDSQRVATLHDCAGLEEESATYLEGLLETA